MRRPAVLRAVPLRLPMNVSFDAPPSFEGVRRRRDAVSRPRPPKLRLVHSVPSEEAAPLASAELEPVPTSPSVDLIPERDSAVEIRIADIVIDDLPLPAPVLLLRAVERPNKRAKKKPASKPRERREVSAFLAERELKADYKVVGQYVRYVLGIHQGQHAYLERCINTRLRRDETARDLPPAQLMAEEVERLGNELIELLRQHALWLPDETRQGYAVCRFRRGNAHFFTLIDREGEGTAKIIAVLTSTAYRQSVQDRPSPRKMVRTRSPSRTQRDDWRSYDS